MRSLVRPKRPLVVGAVLLTALVTLWLFVPTVMGYFATYNVASITASPTDVAVSDDGQTLVVTFEVHNPTSQPIRFHGGHVIVFDGDTRLSDGTTMQAPATTVSGGETATVTGAIGVSGGSEDRARRAAGTGTLRYSGELDAGIRDHTFSVDVGGDVR